MIHLELETATPSPERQFQPTLADLSRNASVISTSSSDSFPSPSLNDSPRLAPPARPRPIRTFSAPRSRSPQPRSPGPSRPPTYLTRDLKVAGEESGPSLESRIQSARKRSRSRNPSVSGRLTAQDFQFGKELGTGSYSHVVRGTYLATMQDYAVKILDKGHLARHKKGKTAIAEKDTLVRLGRGHPGIVRLHWTFHDEWSLYFVLDLVPNGDLQGKISRLGSLSTTCAQYYGAQIADALAYMHSKGVIHRDLKPENILLDDAYRIKIVDFGTGKIVGPGTERTNTWVGTAQYVAPELVESNETSESSDIWSLGCIIYQMIAGRFAFQGLSDYLTWQKIKQLDYTFPEGFDEQAKDLCNKIFLRDPAARLGAGPPGSPNDMDALRAHPFFGSIDWKTLWTRPAPPLEAGLVKKNHPLASGEESGWDGIGAAWDDLVEHDSDETDETDGIPWAADAAAPPFMLRQYGTGAYEGETLHSPEIGPMGETPRYHHRRPEPALDEDAETVVDYDEPAAVGGPTAPIPVPGAATRGDADSLGSGTSSSNGSPVDTVSKGLTAMQLEDEARGRNRAQTPIQGHGLMGLSDWSAALVPGESIIFSGQVEARAIRRRTSRLLPINVSPMKAKTRQLLLTTERLVCLKPNARVRDGFTVKRQFALTMGEGKESKHVLHAVEPKGEREFVVLTVRSSSSLSPSAPRASAERTRKFSQSTKSQSYAAPTAVLASMWISKIKEAMEEAERERERKTEERKSSRWRDTN